MRKSFGKIKDVLNLPNLIEVQLSSFEKFLQKEIPPEKRENCGLEAIFRELFPIEDPHRRYSLEYVKYTIKEPKVSDFTASKRGSTYSSPLYVTFRLVSRDDEGNTKNVVEQEIYLCDFPIITNRGTFVINGVEKAVVNQLRRAPGVYFSETIHPTGKKVFKGEIIPYHGSWIEFTTDANDILLVNLDKRHRFPATTLFKALEFVTNEDILTALYEMEEVPLSKASGRWLGRDCIESASGVTLAFAGAQITQDLINSLASFGIEKVTCSKTNDLSIILLTLKKDENIKNKKDALHRIYYLLRGTSPGTTEMSEAYLRANYFSHNYDLSTTGRYKINKRLNTNVEGTTLQVEDIINIVKYMLNLARGEGNVDDIDHLGNRHLKRVGELLSDQVKLALGRVSWQARERMLLHSREPLTPMDLINTRLFTNVVMNFFLVSQLCQFMDQTNPLAEISHLRRLSRLGPGGLTRKTAGLEVRDVHYSHYGRICPIETPEGPNIGIISYLSTYAKVDKYGFIVTPYRKIINGRVTNKIEYLTADEEDPYVIAQANAPLYKDGRFVEKVALSRKGDNYPIAPVDKIDYMDISPKQLVSISAALIPFLEHDDANRALMGSNMQRQAVPLLFPDPPLVGTGLEEKVARDSASAIIARADGLIRYLDANHIVIEPDGDTIEPDIYGLIKFRRTNQDTCINQTPIVSLGDKVKKGSVIVDGAATKEGELALGKNILVAFMPWLGYNFEDAIVISERLLKEDTFTSLHIQQLEGQVRDTKLGPEEITREIPNVSEQAIKDLDANGIIRIGAMVEPDDILVGKVSPKGEVELTPEERLIRAIFGEKARDVKDTSLRVPPGVSGVVTDVVVLSKKSNDKITKEEIKNRIKEIHISARHKIVESKRIVNNKKKELLKGKTALIDIKDKKGNVKIKKGRKISLLNDGVLGSLRITKKSIKEEVYEKLQELNVKQDEAIKKIKTQEKVDVKNASEGDGLPPGVLKVIKVYIGQKRRIMVGDKLSGRHGNKGTIAKIASVEDIPYLSDGRHVDMILNPLGVPSRMNVGQVLETLLGHAAKLLGISVSCPVFEGAEIEEIEEMLKEAHLPSDGKAILYDGRTGEPFHDKVTVGYIYMMKLSHMVEDKVHARSIGSYSLVTQQPLGGKAQFGGQRLGEMEVWALESYGAAYTLQEMLTVKSDDVAGRKNLYEALVKGESPPKPRLPISFNVLLRELAGLCMEIELVKER